MACLPEAAKELVLNPYEYVTSYYRTVIPAKAGIQGLGVV